MSLSTAPAAPLLAVSDLSVEFRTREGVTRAIDNVSFSLAPGEMVGIVGESGSGKSVTSYVTIGLVDYPARVTSGSVRIAGIDMLSSAAVQARGRLVGMVFQNPMNALSPTSTIGTQLDNVLLRSLYPTRAARMARILETLEQVSLDDPRRRLAQYPHELSGGLLQRICIAMALLNKPNLLIADEPTTALDVTTQAQIVSTVVRLCRESGVGLIWISHDLALVSRLVDRIIVMYAGQIVETGTVAEVFSAPRHPYTQALLRSVPSLNRGRPRLAQIRGYLERNAELLAGCRFRNRCDDRSTRCDLPPPEIAINDTHCVRCWKYAP